MTTTAVHAALNKIVAESELSFRAVTLLAHVAVLPREECTVRGMAKAMQVSKPAITRAVDALERYAFAKRKRDMLDRRSIFILPTKDGKDLVKPLLSLVQ